MEIQNRTGVPVLSVVIPAYNSAKFIDRTLTSVLEQSVGPECYEVILIDDGSTDATLSICLTFAQKYPNLRVEHQENKGVSAARNLGVSLARGKWITFVDSDDYVEDHYVQTVIAASPESEYVIFDNYLEKNNRSIREKEWLRPFADRSCDLSQLLFWTCDQQLNVPWDKRYNLALIREKHIRFPDDISLGEDLVFNFSYALCVGSAYVSSAAVYHYVDNPGGLTGSGYTVSRFVQMERLYERTQKLCRDCLQHNECEELLDRSFLRNIARCGGRLHCAGFSHRQISELFDQSEMVRKVLAGKTESPKDLVRKILLKIHLYSLCAVLISAK